MEMIRYGYAMERLRSKLHNFRETFFKNSPIKPTINTNRVHGPVVRDKIGGWSLNEFGYVSKGKVEHPGIINC